MASRGMQAGFLNNPRSGAAGGRGGRPQSSSAFGRFLQNEIFAEEKRPGNLVILYGVGFFAAGVTLLRTVGTDLLVPVF
ncbi:hypothetical protein CF319_g5998 [Tilletia indica]|uniref:Uncharacterized protein n=2 Tax=Tilletia TaxID=13289 RepID=A0A8X7N7D7_9BASI|nr:hypothetical protein CF327_g3980 [Tilletia walkeri]KAE8220487.1 hypothetical protein CF319_g5998 [Tilletia indica]KAE8232761.1 hypothetical protein CF326_g2207 [Tilletia indica]KAE8257704.1 hypothetical protein A4X13_0g2179 [Tilletia indica]KAE8268582.1 hypothetical protein A4X09_0g3762 [Tilletia walkeri]